MNSTLLRGFRIGINYASRITTPNRIPAQVPVHLLLSPFLPFPVSFFYTSTTTFAVVCPPRNTSRALGNSAKG